MAYNNAIPTASQRLQDSQPQLLENFKTISALLGVDHVISPWTSPVSGNEGKHNQVTLPEQASGPTTAADEMALYTKAVSGKTNMFIRREGAGTELNISGGTLANDGTVILPSGIVLKWGRGITSSGIATVNFPTTFAFSATPYIVMAVGASSTGDSEDARKIAFYVNGWNTTTTTVYAYSLDSGNIGTTHHFTWFAVGI